MTTTETKTDLQKEIAALAAREIAVETNEGTYGASEACRAIGTGDPKFADYTIWERVGDGKRRVQGCDPQRAPGRARKLGLDDMAESRRRLADLRSQLRA